MTDDPTGDETQTYTLDELSRLSGVSRRTIRYYQAEHLLPRPGKAGRDAVYGRPHLERLALIGGLRDRGLTLQTISQLVATQDPGRTVTEWLGVGETLVAPWSEDRPRIMTTDELTALLAQLDAARPGLLAELKDGHFVVARTDGTWDVPSPKLLEHAIQLHRAGFDIDVTARLQSLLRRRLAKAVDDIVELLVERMGTGFAGSASPEELTTAIDALRPLATESAGVILAREVERALAALAQAGPRAGSRSRRR